MDSQSSQADYEPSPSFPALHFFFCPGLTVEDDLHNHPFRIDPAIAVCAAYLVPLLTMEINYFRRAMERSSVWRDGFGAKGGCVEGRDGGGVAVAAGVDDDDDGSFEADEPLVAGDDDDAHVNDDDEHRQSPTAPDADAKLVEGYREVRRTAAASIGMSLLMYAGTAAAVSFNTRGLEDKAVVVLIGVSRLFAALMALVASAKVPQWIGVYHHGAVRLVKCSSEFSRHVENDSDLLNLRRYVRRGVCLHFAKFYVAFAALCCGARPAAVPASAVVGAACGFFLTGTICAVRRRFRHRRNAVALGTILLLTVLSSLTFVRGASWIQAVWGSNLTRIVAGGGGVLQVVSFFAWVVMSAVVHVVFIRMTTKEGKRVPTTGNDRRRGGVEGNDDFGGGGADSEYDSFRGRWLFDGDETSIDRSYSDSSGDGEPARDGDGGRGFTLVANEAPSTGDGKANFELEKRSLRERKRGSLAWRVACRIKPPALLVANGLCLYFVTVNVGATKQIANTREKLPAVHEALYLHMDDGPVCAFDNRGSESDIRTFADRDVARDAGYLVVHCGACGACSSWRDLVVQYARRNDMAALANVCATESLFGGGEDGLHGCLTDDDIGFTDGCATCWSEDIRCTKKNCAFIFLQAQMVNNVGNFEVGPDDVTSASCEEAHCEVGQFVPCSGATRRRMNITSSIKRPGTQQCSIVDIQDWEDIFFGSGVA